MDMRLSCQPASELYGIKETCMMGERLSVRSVYAYASSFQSSNVSREEQSLLL
jgi:hypothetical protein